MKELKIESLSLYVVTKDNNTYLWRTNKIDNEHEDFTYEMIKEKLMHNFKEEVKEGWIHFKTDVYASDQIKKAFIRENYEKEKPIESLTLMLEMKDGNTTEGITVDFDVDYKTTINLLFSKWKNLKPEISDLDQIEKEYVKKNYYEK